MLWTRTAEAGGSFEAPQHEYPTALVLELTAADAAGLVGTARIRLEPLTVQLGFATDPPGLELYAWPDSDVTPFQRTVPVGSQLPLIAISPQTLAATGYRFERWADGGEPVRVVLASPTPVTYTALYAGPGASIFANGFDDGTAHSWDEAVGD